MGSSLRTRETLLYGESPGRTFQEIIEAGDTAGWHTFDQSLLKAYEANLITEDTATIFCAHKNKMRRDLDIVKKLRGTTVTELRPGCDCKVKLKQTPWPISNENQSNKRSCDGDAISEPPRS